MKSDEQLRKDPSEAEIADAVATLLEWSTELDAKDIYPRVEDGWITLEGSVSRLAESQAAARLASQIRGVKGVSNRIRIEAGEPVSAMARTMTEHGAGWTPIDEEC